ncbi:siderophore biosynthesis protein [Colletotrichum plurivorum]|uniref:Siderophore biosynthesis protein n=1 Tax=Colletotrichum plurivorum TaxID=2175906 RepID=A0A8H6K967_9PEZI|nr:siderophore biosynthesis protein [Colletotrichum plurivorum]
MSRYVLCLLATTATTILAASDLAGCTSFTSTIPAASGKPSSAGHKSAHETVIWYRPGTWEICQDIDCGGGRAPPRNVPGCPGYTGTDTVERKFLTADPAASAEPETTVTTTAKRTSTVVRFVTATSTSKNVTSTATVTRLSSITLPVKTVSGTATNSVNGTISATVTEASKTENAEASTTQPTTSPSQAAGVVATARAGIAAALGVAAAVVLV